MEDNIGKLGIMDFFNVLFAGGSFMICLCWITPWFWNKYIVINEMHEYESYVGIIIVFFIVGIVLQEMGRLWDDKIGHIKENVLGYFLCKKISFLQFSNNQCDNNIINNDIKLKVYRKYGKDILKNKEFEFNDEFTKEQCKYIYAYCLYYIENKGRSGKYEKMRGLFDMSRTLTTSSMILSLWSFIMFVYYILFSQCGSSEIVCIAQILLFAVFAIIFYYRAVTIMKYKARMLMGVYDVCKDIESEN